LFVWVQADIDAEHSLEVADGRLLIFRWPRCASLVG
jgi:hypothetical protein